MGHSGRPPSTNSQHLRKRPRPSLRSCRRSLSSEQPFTFVCQVVQTGRRHRSRQPHDSLAATRTTPTSPYGSRGFAMSRRHHVMGRQRSSLRSDKNMYALRSGQRRVSSTVLAQTKIYAESQSWISRSLFRRRGTAIHRRRRFAEQTSAVMEIADVVLARSPRPGRCISGRNPIINQPE